MLLKLILPLLLLVPASAGEAEQIAFCNDAMMRDFEGISQEDMMNCAELLEDPLRRIEEENKRKEEAEKEARRKAKIEEEKKAAAEALERKRLEEEERAKALARLKEREEYETNYNKAKKELETCKHNFENALVVSGSLQSCELKIKEIEATHVAIDPRLKPIFGNHRAELVALPILVIFSVLFWLLGCFVGTSRMTPILYARSSVVVISDILLSPGSEVFVISNKSNADIDMTGCQLRVGSNEYAFDEGFNLAKATSIEVHAGPEAHAIKKLQEATPENEKFDSRRTSKLYWTKTEILAKSGEHSASLTDAQGNVVSVRSK